MSYKTKTVAGRHTGKEQTMTNKPRKQITVSFSESQQDKALFQYICTKAKEQGIPRARLVKDAFYDKHKGEITWTPKYNTPTYTP